MSTDPTIVRYRIIESPVGRLLLAATDEGLVRVAFESEGFDAVLADLAKKLGSEPVEDADALTRAADELAEYFAGDRREFDLPLDRRLSTGFRTTVHTFLPNIPYGHTMSYGDVAGNVQNRRAIRAVGSACARNPLPIVVPCHRVVRADRSLGGYLGGLEVKAALLELEGVRLPV